MANLRVVPETVGDRIVLLLRRRKWDVKDLAEETGIPASSLSRYINDETAIRGERLVAIARALDVTPNELLLGSETDSNESHLRPGRAVLPPGLFPTESEVLVPSAAVG